MFEIENLRSIASGDRGRAARCKPSHALGKVHSVPYFAYCKMTGIISVKKLSRQLNKSQPGTALYREYMYFIAENVDPKVARLEDQKKYSAFTNSRTQT